MAKHKQFFVDQVNRVRVIYAERLELSKDGDPFWLKSLARWRKSLDYWESRLQDIETLETLEQAVERRNRV